MLEDLPVLLNFRTENNNLILRLDNPGLQNFEAGEQSVCELTLENFIEKENIFDNFQELIGEVFEYEIHSEKDVFIFEFWGDYGRIVNTIEFKSFREENSDYTIEDLRKKGTMLAALYSDTYKRCIHNENIFYRLRNKLVTELQDEIERFQRKAEFFESKDQSKSEAFSSQIKVLRKLLNILEKLQ